MDRIETIKLYEYELNNFYDNVFKFWSQLPSKFVSEFVEFFPKTVYMINSRAGTNSLSILKQQLNSFISIKIDYLTACVEQERNVNLDRVHRIHTKPPLTFTFKSIDSSLYPIELSCHIDKLIEEIIIEIYSTTKYTEWMRSDSPKINKLELSKLFTPPHSCLENMKRLKELELQMLRIVQEDIAREASEQKEIARHAWENA
ncbi:hypothetical protein ACTG18_08680 [Aeromonas hydrophila]|uniref:hypothetical protein n=1 Tax=Aeromonas hydrophila TaxID=644 RepID=UPI003F79E65F